VGAEHEVGLVLVQHERAVGEVFDRRFVEAPLLGVGVAPLAVELLVDRICPDLAGVEVGPQRGQRFVG
jgi:hypothetical protein